MAAAPFEDWYKHMPIVTKTYMTGCVITSLAVFLEVIHPLDLYLNYNLVFNKYEVTTILTFIFID
jgi:Derlin-2/3